MQQQIRIDVRLPEGHWAGDITRLHPSATLRIEQHMPLREGRGTARCWCDENLELNLQSHKGIDEYLGMDDGHFSVDISAGGGGFVGPLVDIGIVPRTPFEVRDGWAEWTIEATRNDVRELIQRFRIDEFPHRLVSTRNSRSRLLTQRQREVFELATREGYWDVPRRINLTELAAVLGVAKSTLSNQLQRIESAVFNAFAEDIRRQSP
ncbi:MAG TPA: helix-turn-helix domain-containing protein [Poseidonia sp.]|nr:helix-turn-helix domain-containing protein [Poseidonia sp.]